MNIKDEAPLARAFIADSKVDFPSIYDPTAKIGLQLKGIPLTGLPLTVLLDTHQRIAALYIGPVLPTDLTPVLRTLSGEK